MKLALGTVQFGLSYGAFNTSGQVSRETVADILDAAAKAGVDTLDTARVYGASEEVLGAVPQVKGFRVVTKCPPISSADDLAPAFAQSQAALGQPIYGYLMHRAEALLGEGADSIWDALCKLRDSGAVRKIGVSAYALDEVQAVHDRFPITLAQLPANVLTPWYQSDRLPEGVELHARSAFLQGFLLSDPNALPTRFAPWAEVLKTFRSRAAALGLTPLQAALAPLLQPPSIARVVVGVDSLAQWSGILDAIDQLDLTKAIELGPFEGVTAELTDPRLW